MPLLSKVLTENSVFHKGGKITPTPDRQNFTYLIESEFNRIHILLNSLKILETKTAQGNWATLKA